MKIAVASYSLIATILLFAGQSMAQGDSSNRDKATVYIIRKTGITGSAFNDRINMNDTLLCRISNARYCVHHVTPGSYTFSVYQGMPYKLKEGSIQIDMEAGKTYYIKTAIRHRFFENILYLQELAESSAMALIKSLKKEPDCGN